MKCIILTLLYSTFAINNIFGQFSKEEREIRDIIIAQDSIPRNVFLDSTLLPNMKVNATNAKQVWISNSNAKVDIEQLFDIRIKFPTHDSATAFHRQYIRQNSEYGPEIKKHKIKAEGTDDFRIFRGNDFVNKMVEAYGIQMYCFLFVVDNYFVKIYITCDKDCKPEKFQNLITEAIKRIKT